MSDSLDPISTIGGGGGGSGGDSLPSASDPTTVQLPAIEVSTLVTYIKEVVSPALEGRAYVHPSLINLLEHSSSQDKLRQFITDTQVKSILIQRFSSKEDEEVSDHSSESSDNVAFSITEEASYSNPRVTGHLLIKKSPVLEADKNIASQLLYMFLDNTNVYETLHYYVSTGIGPVFKSYVRETKRAERDGDKMVPSTEKRIAELEMNLLHLQQNIDIPEINLQVHPTVLTVMKKCAEEGRKATVNDFADRIDDSVFLNQLQNQVNRWIREIQKVTKLDRDASTGTALQEISFWLNLERALLRIQEKRETPEVALTLDILKKGKRFHATVSFDADTRLKEALAIVNDYNPLMKDFPLNDLLSATDLDKIRSALQVIFHHIGKIQKTKYPIERALKLLEAISRDLMTQLLKVLKNLQIMFIPFMEFTNLMKAYIEVLETWNTEFSELRFFYRNIIGHKRDENYQKLWNMNFDHDRLRPRLDQIMCFRNEHEKSRTAIIRVLSLFNQSTTVTSTVEVSDLKKINSVEENVDFTTIEEIELAYESVSMIDPFDLSSRGSDSWESALKSYEERIDRIEGRISDELRDQLGKAKNADEMFNIFSRFNEPFVPPQIRGALREYSTKFIQLTSENIKVLHQKFINEVKLLNDVPPVAGIFIRNLGIVKQLEDNVKQVKNVLGNQLYNDEEGRTLVAYADSFYHELKIKILFEEWTHDVQQRQFDASDRIFKIESVTSRSGKRNMLKLSVNFMPELFTLPQEVEHLETSYPFNPHLTLFILPPSRRMRDLDSFEFGVPDEVIVKAHQVDHFSPFVISLIQSVDSYERACEKVDEKPTVILLVAGMKKDVQTILCEGVSLTWESDELNLYVKGLEDFVQEFHEKVDELLAISEQIEIEVKSLETCAYSSTVFAEILNRIQKSVDDLSLHRYSNLNQWVNKLDEEVEKRLASRLHAGIKAWTSALVGQEKDDMDVIPDTETVTTPVCKAGGDPKIQALYHEFRITNQVMYINPSIEEARFNLLQQLFAWENVTLLLNRIESTRYQVGLDRSSVPQYRMLMKKMTDGHTAIEQAYEAIEDKIQQMKIYVDQWLRYQSLWDLQPDMLYAQLGDDISKWMNTLTEIKKSRSIFDTTETRKEIGPIIIDYAKVQSKVTLKYDSWHKEVLSKFGSLLGHEMVKMHTLISKSRSELEQQSIDTANTKEAVTFITYVQSLKSKMRQWEKQVDIYKEGQRVLERQRFQFPTNWLHVDNIEGEWSAFNEIMRRKDAAIQAQVASLQVKIVAEDKFVETRTTDLLSEWEKGKPVEGSLPPNEATARLQLFETKFTRLREDRDNVMKAKEALELLEPGASPVLASDEKLDVALEELQDLKAVWSELSKIWSQIETLKELPWLSVQPRKVRQSLDNLMNQLKEMPARFRQYASYEYVKRSIQSNLKVNMIIIELKSDALKERHWKQLTKQLRVRWVLNDLTLGQVWDVDLQQNESIVRDVILIAQGEMALEEFLKQVREAWQNYELDLISYQNKCRLIRGWDDLFNKVKEHINSITAMKLSPYYKEFEEDALAWEEKLNRINALFDVWIDVQRRWVYLEGIFSGSSDIQALLPVETQRFHSISTEFLTLMKKVSKSPLIMDVLNIPGVQKSLERLADLLAKIQKALGEYLERERSSFPRFYFVGDEDLLEIIGNSKNIPRLQKHFRKMFAGVSSIILDEDSTHVLGLSSKEGEEVRFSTPVSIKDHPKINEWLALVEQEMRITLGKLLAQAVSDSTPFKSGDINPADYLEWLDKYQAQIIVLAAQIGWSEYVESALATISAEETGNIKPLEEVLKSVEKTLNVLADSVLQEQPALRRKKLEHLITEFVHKRDVTRSLIRKKVTSPKSFHWLNQMRFYFDPRRPSVLKQLSIVMANAKFNYGFEYLGVQDKLVQTPLTDRCYLTMTQALEARLGGSPFGPAGTGKTESVKALGNQLGRFVLVFNCDETFDFQAMGRIFVGLCQVGAWGCFDEFNRLEERMLSAVSQQIQQIQETLKFNQNQDRTDITVELLGKQVRIVADMAIFITMNPGYAGRSNLPDNLKKLFRSLAMNKPDRQLIAEVMLFSQGFRTAEKLANKIVPFFKLCDEQLSNQSHYDFGLRALKNVLVSAGNIKRDRIAKIKEDMKTRGDADLIDEARIAEQLPEQEILIQSVCETMVPKLVAEDIPLLFSLLSDVFPGIPYTRAEMAQLKEHIAKVCQEMHLICGIEKGDSNGENAWIEKVLQLYQISNLNHGLMMVGPSGSGKSTAWRVLLKALERFEGIEGVAHVIDPKAISKEALYGNLDSNTREWTDGLFTHILRKIIDNIRGEINKRQWIIFDGDVDPEWVENLNSVLDDNKLLTLPNGERLSLPPNVRIMFEVQDLKYATLATVSRCGMIWFSEDVLSTEMICENFFLKLSSVPLEETEEDSTPYGSKKKRSETSTDLSSSDILSPNMQVQRDTINILRPYFSSDGLVIRALEFSATQEHIMDFTRLRALNSLFSMLNEVVRRVLNYNHNHSDFPMPPEQLESYISKSLVYAILWSFAGDAKLKSRCDLGDFIRNVTTIPLPPNTASLPIIDYEVAFNGEWVPWQNRVPQIEVETHKVAAPDVVVPTLDTVRHESLLKTWLAEHNPIVLCGPPGSGKTMTLFSALRSLPDMEVVGLNFSSATSPELLLKTFDHYCEYRKTPNGIVLAPVQLGKWLILFCDEINLPDMDKYGTMRVISFLRQMVGHGGFYRTTDQAWIRLERIQFVGACNPPTDPGRKPLSHRFLRHVPVVYVDYPGETSLKQIYGTFNRAMLRVIPSLRAYADPLTSAMVEFYLMSQERFTQDMQPHYVYSPRELTRWVRGIYEAIRPLETLTVEGLVRLWAHEALRLFQDRLVADDERIWTDENVDMVGLKHFPNIDRRQALDRPILYSNWTSKDYIPVDRGELREFIKARLKVFYEEELDVQLVLFNEVLDHVLRIDRIFRQPQGHVLLIGVSGAGKTTLSRFVAWMNGLSIFQIKVHNKYTAADFDEDLRCVLRRSGCKDEKIAFILDESNVLDSSFLERMNTLLANGEVPGLFEGDEFTTLMTQCKEASQREGLMLDSNEELYRWFTQQVMRNLHVVFTMNPSSEGLKDKSATSPALFNRCVINWFGDWSDEALYEVGKEFTAKLDIDRPSYRAPEYFPTAFPGTPMPATHRVAIVNALVFFHQTLHLANKRLLKRGSRITTITPRHYLDFINHYVKLFHEKCSELEDEQLHLNVGLSKIRETVEQVEELQKSLALKTTELEAKNQAANTKLKEMLKDQQEAEKRKLQSQDIQAQLKKQEEAIQEKRASVMADLSQVEPAVEEAQQAVQSIKKQNLVEVKSMSNPPPPVKMALESICLLLGESTSDWKVIRSVLQRDNFISTIVNFQTDNITNDIRQKMRTKYLENPDYNFEKVNRASLACGPLVKWAIAQLNYSSMLKRIEPLRNELTSLQSEAESNKKKAADIDSVIANLEKSIASYKEEYANLVSQAQAIKADLASVQAKVDRSIALISSLSSERERWELSSETFKHQMQTIAGDVLLASAFLAYAGYFDQQYRQNLFNSWCTHLQQASILFRPDLARTEYLSTADERLRWQANCLPSDDLCVENAIMLKRFNRYPLIIDPSGQATKFLLNEFSSKKITKTSFLDDSFRKNLESALRFGNPLLVQDVENYDPILNPVLNREVRKTGGRVLITLGDQDIDLSPSFSIFLSTRDPTVEFSPDLCSRVTFVNFTVTRSSLQSQCLNQVLKAERPDIDEKRSDLLKLQGEFHVKLRQLEKSLLQALNDAKGRILDDDNVIGTLEKLKNEAADIFRKVEETDKVMAEVDAVSQQYMPLSHACSSIYFTLEGLNQVHFLYQYSLQFFLDIYSDVLLRNPHLEGVNEPNARLSIVTKDLFENVYRRVTRGMLHDDWIVFALLLCKIHLRGFSAEPNFENEFDHFLRGREGILLGQPTISSGLLNTEQLENGTALSKLPAFKSIQQKIDSCSNLKEWIDTTAAEENVPQLWDDEKLLTYVGIAMHQLLITKAFRPDRVIAMARKVVETVLGTAFLSAAETELDMTTIVQKEIKPTNPILMCYVPGYDASGRVEDLSAELGIKPVSIALGSAEGFSRAEKAINSASKNGGWVILKNVHLAPQWLVQLEKKLHTLLAHPGFRLFLTFEINPKVPVNLLRAGRIFVFEPPPGIKANLLRTFNTIPAERMTRLPAERSRLYFLLAWFHAIVQERLRYCPLGWSKKYEFNESDLRVASDTLDTWIDSVALNRTNLPPEKVPWDAIRILFGQCIYGGKIDNDFDQRLLTSFLNKLFTFKSFEPDFGLTSTGSDGKQSVITMPEGNGRDHFLEWVDSLPDKQTPSWLGLPDNAEKVLLTNQGANVVSKLLKLQLIEDDEDVVYVNESETSEGTRRVKQPSGDGRPAWMRTLLNSTTNWLRLLPNNLQTLHRTVENIKDPLYRYFEREVNSASRLLDIVRHDLDDVLLICKAAKKQTNHHRLMISDLAKGVIPNHWRKYTVPQDTTVLQWIADFSDRVKQLQKVSNRCTSGGASVLKGIDVWLGGLFNPEAYITATRQYVAQANNWSLEELYLEVEIADSDNQNIPMDECSFGVIGLKLQGAKTIKNKLYLTSAIMTDSPLTRLRWSRTNKGTGIKGCKVTLPVYLNLNRSAILFTVDLEAGPNHDEFSFYERGVAFISSSLG